jgi:hypothetical protein
VLGASLQAAELAANIDLSVIFPCDLFAI